MREVVVIRQYNNLKEQKKGGREQIWISFGINDPKQNIIYSLSQLCNLISPHSLAHVSLDIECPILIGK